MQLTSPSPHPQVGNLLPNEVDHHGKEEAGCKEHGNGRRGYMFEKRVHPKVSGSQYPDYPVEQLEGVDKIQIMLGTFCELLLFINIVLRIL